MRRQLLPLIIELSFSKDVFGPRYQSIERNHIIETQTIAKGENPRMKEQLKTIRMFHLYGGSCGQSVASLFLTAHANNNSFLKLCRYFFVLSFVEL